ncbi:MAG: SOS response-associated peptidase [Ancalomicrobiaceae bacterium]|nr:SOS response-associated peptidase [Ancalomicrobiaceae bacterium]
MCARFTLTAPPDEVRALFRYDDLPNFPARYNIAPTQPIAIVAVFEGRRRFMLARWGLIPGWAKNPAELPLMINARAETVADKPSFRGAFRHRRMLVPATGFYEWQRLGKGRQPFHIRLAADQAPDGLFAFAGIWETYLAADGSEIDTAAILTLPSLPPVSAVHDRMPAVVMPADFDRWLDCRETSPDEALQLIVPGVRFDLFPVSTRVNSVRSDDEGLVVPLAEPMTAAEPEPEARSAIPPPAPSPDRGAGDTGERDLFGAPTAPPRQSRARRGTAKRG